MFVRSPRAAKRPLMFLEDDSDQDEAISSEPGVPAEEEVSTSDPSWGHSCSPGRGRGDEGDAFQSRSPNPSGWKTEADPDDAVPQPPRFTPKRTPGVQPPLNLGNPSPSEIFSQFIDSKVLKLLCENTNKNAAKNRKQGKKYRWTTKVTPEEMKRYIGVLLYMSVLDLPKITDFWRKNTIFHVGAPATIMPRDRFKAISASVHMTDPTEDVENEKKKGTEDYDHLHLVRPLLEMMRIRCMAIYHPKQHIAVDERMVATKARLSIKQYMKAKPTKWGLKFFVLADVNGYTIDFKLYAGKCKFASGKGLSFDVVAGLVNKDFLGSGYVIYVDNFYTSPPLFRYLGQLGFGACGTYRPGRVGFPTTQENALNRKSPRGSIRWIREGDLLFVKWMDAREVSLCSNIHSVYSGDTVHRWEKTGDGKRQRIAIPRPTVVTEYNKYMGGVDTSDQMLGTNTVHRKTRRWTITVFQHALDIAATNSYVIHKELCASSQKRYMTRQSFQEELCAQLLGVPLGGTPQKPPGHNHFPIPTSSGQVKAQVASMGRRKCKLCNKCTPWQCQLCNVALCLVPNRNCFLEFHTNQPGDTGLCLQPEEGDGKNACKLYGEESTEAD